jgi:hypothetical protein
VDCDNSERAIERLFDEHLPNARSLPFVAIVTPDLRWVAGKAGFLDATRLSQLVDEVEKSPLLQASAETAKRLEAMAGEAESAVASSQWQRVVAVSRSAGALRGRSPSRERIAAARTRAHAWAEGESARVLASLQKDGDRAAAKTSLEALASVFAGEPEAQDAEAGRRALARLTAIDGFADPDRAPARAAASREFSGTRWGVLFTTR